MRFFRKNAALLLLAAAFQLAGLSAYAAERLTILHVNDFHGRVFPQEGAAGSGQARGGAAFLAAMIKAERLRNEGGTILLSAGDMFQGTPISDIFRGRPVVEIMNSLRFDAMTVGNHELDWGWAGLAAIVQSARFPLLSANTVDGSGSSPPGLKRYVILERKGVRVAVIGVTTPETAFAVKRQRLGGLAFLDPEKVLPEIVSEVRRKGARLVVLLSHLGIDGDRRVAAGVAGIDVIVGGHSHTVLADPLVVGKTVIVQAGSEGLYLGVLDLLIEEKTGKVVAATEKGELRPVVAAPAGGGDDEVARIAERYRREIKKTFDEVVGEATVPLRRNERGESNLGDLIADAMRQSAGSQIAIQNSGGIRADVPAGKITMEQVYTVLPFDDVLVSMDLTGDLLLDLVEEAFTRGRGLPQVSGMTITCAVESGRPRVGEVRVGGAPIDRSKTYRVVTNDFLAGGGDRLTVFKKGRNRACGKAVRDAVVDYLRRYSPVAPRTEGRIVITGERRPAAARLQGRL